MDRDGPAAARRSGDDDVATLSLTIAAHRARLGLSLTAASRRSGMSTAHLSRIERGERVPTLTVLLQLARAYGVPLGVLVGEKPSSASSVTVRRAATPTQMAGGTTVEPLGSNDAAALLQAVRATLDPGTSTEPRSHQGEEWIHVEAGAVTLEVEGHRVDLAAGDSAQFDSARGHRVVNASDTSARVLVVSSARPPERHHSPPSGPPTEPPAHAP